MSEIGLLWELWKDDETPRKVMLQPIWCMAGIRPEIEKFCNSLFLL
jgi:hypothetical protein